MSTNAATAQTLDPAQESWVAPGASDGFATAGLITLLLLLFLVIYLCAVFDRYAEHRGSRTPIRTTISTMLVIGLAYDLVPPLRDVSLLLPATLILAAFAYDVVLWMKPEPSEDAPLPEAEPATTGNAPPPVADPRAPVEQKGASA